MHLEILPISQLFERHSSRPFSALIGRLAAVDEMALFDAWMALLPTLLDDTPSVTVRSEEREMHSHSMEQKTMLALVGMYAFGSDWKPLAQRPFWVAISAVHQCVSDDAILTRFCERLITDGDLFLQEVGVP
jgi:hypothetical protein